MAARQQIEVSFKSFLCTHLDNSKARGELRAFHSQKRMETSYFGLSAFVRPSGQAVCQPIDRLRPTRSATSLQRCSGQLSAPPPRGRGRGYATRRDLGEMLAATASRQLYKAAV